MKTTRKSKADKALDALCERLYNKHSQGFQIDILKINPLFADFRAAVLSDVDPDEAMIALVKKYCEPA